MRVLSIVPEQSCWSQFNQPKPLQLPGSKSQFPVQWRMINDLKLPPLHFQVSKIQLVIQLYNLCLFKWTSVPKCIRSWPSQLIQGLMARIWRDWSISLRPVLNHYNSALTDWLAVIWAQVEDDASLLIIRWHNELFHISLWSHKFSFWQQEGATYALY